MGCEVWGNLLLRRLALFLAFGFLYSFPFLVLVAASFCGKQNEIRRIVDSCFWQGGFSSHPFLCVGVSRGWGMEVLI